MAGVNKVILLGRLGADPELRSSPSGVTSCNLSIATSINWTDKNSGEKKEDTEWHRVVFFGRAAEVIEQYMKKGQQMYVEGRLKTSKYEKDGIERFSTSIIGDNFNFISGGASQMDNPSTNTFSPEPSQNENPSKESNSKKDDFEDDIPF